jgi:hypothetical protein
LAAAGIPAVNFGAGDTSQAHHAGQGMCPCCRAATPGGPLLAMPVSVRAPPEPIDAWERHTGDACGLLRGYRRREPEKTLLHEVVRERLSKGEDGRLVYRMKRPRGGSLFLLLTPDELLARLATLVPPPRVHGLRYHGLCRAQHRPW